MQAPSVPKIKKFVGEIKTKCLDDDQASKDPQTTYCTLLKMELLLRGVIVEEDKKLWGEVLSSVGKRLLNDQTVPKPLLSGINVIAGKLAEQFANVQQQFSPMLTEASGPTKRAQDLKDTRLLALLRQDFDPLEVAKGYFLRAAFLNPEKPPMWKQVFDVMIRQHNNDETPYEAQTIIDKLKTIASSKGNVKRSAELMLKLCQSYLNNDRTVADEQSLSVTLAGSDSHLPQKNPLQVAKSAKSTLDECPLEQLDEKDQRMYQILCLRVELAVEDAEIDDMADKKHKANVNRSGGTSLSVIRSTCQKEVLSKPQDPAQEASFGVRDVLLQALSTDNDASLFPDCLKWTQTALLRFREKAQISKTNGGWKILLDFVRPIIETSTSSSSWSHDLLLAERQDKIKTWFSQVPPSMQNLLLSIGYILPLAYWMLLPDNPEPMKEQFQFLWDVISSVNIQDDKGSSLSKKKESTIATETKLARSMIQCLLATQKDAYMFGMYQETVNTKSKETPFPLGHLQCLVSWSGWYQPSFALFSRFGDVRSILAASKLRAGRSLNALEELLFDLAHADAEFLQGGSVQRATDVYLKVLAILEKNGDMEEGMKSLFLSHCNNGLARACKRGAIVPDNGTVEQFASNTLRILEVNHPIAPFHLWHDPASVSKAFAYQLSVARQLIADSLVEKGDCEQAQVILEAAVRDSPRDADAALALGAFLLRVAFFVNAERSEEADKKAQIHLLKAAKLDASQARPFALLGFWFEERGDMARAKGCYAKALNLDPCDPVAGRGILRLETPENAQKYLDVALEQNSTWIGWAWNAIGLGKTMVGEDEFALVALLKAARCQDIRKAHDSSHDIFYQRGSAKSNEEAAVMENIGLCYRRLGRYTAAIRAFYPAIELTKSENSVSISALCSCAQVELELALFEEAAEKFSEILEHKDSGEFGSIAAYGQGVALLSLAERDLRDGKAGSAFAKVTKAIDGCLQLSGEFSCVSKLLGDLYSFGALIPAALFGEDNSYEGGVKKQLEFVSHGESAYRSALASVEASLQTDQSIATQATYRCDIASNILLQAKIVASTEVENTDSGSRSLYEKATSEFENSLNLNPISATAWCGFGCAVDDPLLAQHAFCRSLQIERLLPDGYTNVGFLYTKLHALSASEETMHVLTQVADTPLMWINRAFILEQKSSDGLQTTPDDLRMVLEASDAYRAALQVMKQPDAMIGLAATGMLSRQSRGGLNEKLKKNSLALLNEFLGVASYLRPEAQLLTGLVGMEQAALAKDTQWSNEEVEKGRAVTKISLSDSRVTKSMNLESIEKCLNKPKVKELERKRETPDEFGTQTQILETPNDPVHWLMFAKDVASRIDSTSSKEVVEEALRIAQKASDMLTQNMSSPHIFDNSSKSLNANMVAEALSLVSSLQSIRSEQKEGNNYLGYDLQHAMMICPNNGLAQALLQCSTV